MSKLLAPNGKPSNLTPEQYKLVRTPAFKKWFGDWENDPNNASKIIDENGEPLVVYHGTNNDFTVFNTSYKKILWFGGIDFEIGSHFGTFEQANQLGEIVMPFFLNIKNLIRTTDKFNWIVESYLNIFSELKINRPKTLNNYPDIINGNEYQIIFDTLKKHKIDGIVYINKYEGNRKDDSYIVFNPNQMKLANGSNKTFYLYNPDFRYEKGGETYSNTEKLIVELKKHSDYKKGKEGIDKETGQKYRHDRYTLKYPFASYWLVKLWEKAAGENGDKNARNFIYNNKYSFAFDRGKFKGERDGRISLSEEIELNDDYKQGGKVKTYWYKGLFN